MKKPMFTIFDSAAQVYNNPWCQLNDATAIRSIRQAVFDPNTDIHRSPEDFSLFRIGEYDDETAHLELLPTPKLIAKAHELTQPEPEKTRDLTHLTLEQVAEARGAKPGDVIL